MIAAEFDGKMVALNIRNVEKIIESGVPKALLDVGYEIMRLSQMEVPHDKGSLQNSGTVEEVRGAVVVGYHEPYAARLHEHPEYHFQKGRKGKYLEDPLRRNQEVLGIKFGKDFEEDLREGLH